LMSTALNRAGRHNGRKGEHFLFVHLRIFTAVADE